MEEERDRRQKLFISVSLVFYIYYSHYRAKTILLILPSTGFLSLNLTQHADMLIGVGGFNKWNTSIYVLCVNPILSLGMALKNIDSCPIY
jgi:hypothetical protein